MIGTTDFGCLSGFSLGTSGDASFDVLIRPAWILALGAIAGMAQMTFAQDASGASVTTIRLLAVLHAG